MQHRKKILIIEDEQGWQDVFVQQLAKYPIDIIAALTADAGERAIAEHKDLDIVLLDGCINSRNDPDGLGLVGPIRKTYKGTLIAMSANGGLRSMMLDAGCSYGCEKKVVARHVVRMLDLEPSTP